MSGDATPNLNLVYLDPSQSEPEVKINDAWNKIDALAGELTGITVEDLTQSPPVTAPQTKVLRFVGAHVTSESDGAVVIEIDASSQSSDTGGSITVEGLGDSPHRTVSDVSVIRFDGPVSVEEGSDGVALVIIDAPSVPDIEFVESAVWNSSSASVPIALAVPQDLMMPRASTLEAVYIQTQGPAGSCTVTLSWSAFPFVSGADVTGGTSPAIASGTSYSNTALTGWTKSFAQGVIIRATLTANINFTSVKIFLRFT